MANLKFFRSATAPAAAELGAIWFDSTNKLLKVKNATDWEVYDGGRNVIDATFVNGLLTITKASGENVTLDFKDVASASQTMKAFKELDTAVKNAQSTAETGVANAATAQSTAEAAKTTADSKIASVTGDTTVKANTSAGHAVTLSLATSDKGNVKFTKDADGLSANVTIPAATVTGVAANDKVLSLTNKLVSATIGLDYGDATTEALKNKKAIKLVGKEGVVISEIDASAFIKDGMIQSVEFDAQTKHVTITFNTDAGHDAIDVDLSTLVDTYKAGAGLSLANDGTFSVNTTTIATVENAAQLANAAEQAAKTHANGLKENIDAYTVNGKTISENPVLDGSMIAVGGTGAHKTANLDTTVEDIYDKISDAAAGGVLSFGGQSGDITLATASTKNGDVNLKMTGKELSASIVGLGSAAFTESSAYDTKGAAADVLGKSTDKSTEKTVYGAIALANEKATPGLVDEKITAAGNKYATAAQGTKADNALQSVSASGDDYITASAGAKAGNSQTITVSTNVQAVSSASASAKGLAEASDVKNYVDNHVSTTLAWASFE